ncbi:MAG TPA: MATE family efflux transporter [Bacillota bacterium]|nr:MATE family efflux transporter [Bacillota bacterium]
MDKQFGKDLTVGSIPRHLLAFSVPMLLGNLLQTGYSIINMIWVGNIVGENGVGATAVSFPIIFILIGLAAGATMATSVLVSQAYGAKDYEKVERVVDTSVTISLILSVVLTIAGILASDWILKMMETPVEIFPMASGYLKISLAGFVLMYLMFLITSILRGIGDTVRPLWFMAIAVSINAVLDPLLIIGIGPFPKLGLNGAAIASLFAQGIALVLGLIYLNRKNHFIAINFRKLVLDRRLTGLIFSIGLPSMVQQTLVSIGSIFVTTFVNFFGASATAAFGAASRIDAVAMMPALAIGMGATSLTGQNLGAGKPERVKEVFKWGIIMAALITGVISLLAVSIPRLLLSMFLQDPVALQIGVNYLRIVGAGYIFFGLMFIAIGVVNGAGQTIVTMIFSLLSLWLVRVPLAAYLSRTSLGITGIWIALLISFAVVTGISFLYYFSGRWKKAAAKIQGPMPAPQEILE